MAYIISADDIKQTLPGYDPSKSESFHRESTHMADKEFEQALKTRSEKTVVVMAGGAASGKTEYVSAYLKRRRLIIFDGTLPSFEGAKIKLRNAIKSSKRVEVHLVVPESFLVAFIAFLNRDRKFSVEHFYRTHSKARKSVLKVAKEYENITIKVFVSDVDFVGTGSTMSFSEINFANRDELIEYLEQNQYTKEEIKNSVFHT